MLHGIEDCTYAQAEDLAADESLDGQQHGAVLEDSDTVSYEQLDVADADAEQRESDDAETDDDGST